MREVQATEAKAHLTRLLSAVEQGESISITRYGKPVAHLVPVAAMNQAARRTAVARFQKRRERWAKANFSQQEILDARHEGHRV